MFRHVFKWPFYEGRDERDKNERKLMVHKFYSTIYHTTNEITSDEGRCLLRTLLEKKICVENMLSFPQEHQLCIKAFINTKLNDVPWWEPQWRPITYSVLLLNPTCSVFSVAHMRTPDVSAVFWTSKNSLIHGRTKVKIISYVSYCEAFAIHWYTAIKYQLSWYVFNYM